MITGQVIMSCVTGKHMSCSDLTPYQLLNIEFCHFCCDLLLTGAWKMCC